MRCHERVRYVEGGENTRRRTRGACRELESPGSQSISPSGLPSAAAAAVERSLLSDTPVSTFNTVDRHKNGVSPTHKRGTRTLSLFTLGTTCFTNVGGDAIGWLTRTPPPTDASTHSQRHHSRRVGCQTP
jgi:hypothetical protein